MTESKDRHIRTKSCWILLEIVSLHGSWKVGSDVAICNTFSNPLSSTTENGLQSRAIHFASEFVSLSDVDLLILALSPVIWSSVGCRHRLLVLGPGLLALTAPAVSVLAATHFAFRWYRRLDVLRWYANSFLHSLHKTMLLSRLPLGSFFKMKVALHQSNQCTLIGFLHVRCR